jgi:hypothetical protein
MKILWLSRMQCKLKILCLMWKCVNFPCLFLPNKFWLNTSLWWCIQCHYTLSPCNSLVDSRIEGEVPFPRNQEHHHNYLPPILASNKSLAYFLVQLNILKNYYCHGRNIRANNLFIMPRLDETLPEQQTSFSTITMMSNVVIVMKLPIYYNSCYHSTRFWKMQEHHTKFFLITTRWLVTQLI